MENDEENQRYFQDAKRKGIPNVPKSTSIIQVDVRQSNAYKRKGKNGGIRSRYIT